MTFAATVPSVCTNTTKKMVDPSVEEPTTMSTFVLFCISPTHLCHLLTNTFRLQNTYNCDRLSPKEQRNLIGMNSNCRKYETIYGRSHVSATMRNNDHNTKKHEGKERK